MELKGTDSFESIYSSYIFEPTSEIVFIWCFVQVTCPSSSDSSACLMNHVGSDNLQLLKLSKVQIKSLQEAMYHSTENSHLGELLLESHLVHIFKTILESNGY
jgi:hypothetical protein